MTENEAIRNHERAMEIFKKEFGDNSAVIDLYKISIKALEEIQQYRAIGTVEECQEAMEMRKGKKCQIINGGISVCPICGAKVLRCYDFCKDCGQAIDWSDTD